MEDLKWIITTKGKQEQNLEEPHIGLPPYKINDYQSQLSACGLISVIGTRNLSPLFTLIFNKMTIKRHPFPHPPTSNHVMCNVMFSTLRLTCSPLRCCTYLPDVDSNIVVKALHSFFFFCYLPSVLFTTSSCKTFFNVFQVKM